LPHWTKETLLDRLNRFVAAPVHHSGKPTRSGHFLFSYPCYQSAAPGNESADAAIIPVLWQRSPTAPFPHTPCFLYHPIVDKYLRNRSKKDSFLSNCQTIELHTCPGGKLRSWNPWPS